MSTIWAGYSISYSGMSSAQRSLAVTSSNISNTSTEGYTRKRAITEEICATNGFDSSGTGVDVQSVLRIRNQFLDLQYRQQNTSTGYAEGKSALLTNLQEVVNEFSADDGTTDNGLQQTMTEFLNSWEELSKDPSNATTKSSVLETAQAMLGTFSSMETQLQTMREEMVQNVYDSVSDINTLAGQIASLNDQIMQVENKQVEASDLRDARDLLVDQLSSIVNITTSERENGVVDVYVSGVSLVSGTKAKQLEASGVASAGNPVKVSWQGLDEEVVITGGSILAYLEESDMSGLEDVTNTAKPYYDWETSKYSSALTTLTNGVNDLLVSMAVEVNAIYKTSSAGVDFFTAIDTAKPLSLENIQINPTYTSTPSAIAANTDGTKGNNDIALQLAALENDTTLYSCNGVAMHLDGFYQGVISWMGNAGSTATASYNTEAGLLAQISAQRDDTSSVSMDEELSNMIVYQNAYGASARVMNVVDGLVEGLIADLGG